MPAKAGIQNGFASTAPCILDTGFRRCDESLIDKLLRIGSIFSVFSVFSVADCFFWVLRSQLHERNAY